MLGRATRLCPKINKTHFEIYDPVGVYDSLEEVNTMQPVSADPKTTFAQLLDGLEVLEDEAHIKKRRCADNCQITACKTKAYQRRSKRI